MEFWTVCLPHAEFPALIFDSVRVPGWQTWQTVYHACLSTARAAPDDPPMNDVTGSKNQASVHLPSIQETVHNTTSHTFVLLEQTNMLPQSPNDLAAELTIRAWNRSWHHFSADCFLTKMVPALANLMGILKNSPKSRAYWGFAHVCSSPTSAIDHSGVTGHCWIPFLHQVKDLRRRVAYRAGGPWLQDHAADS